MHRLLYRRTTIALLAILALAFGLRIWGLGWGMPFAFHADEDNYLPGAMTMLFKGDLNPHYFRNPPLLTYAVLLELLAYLGVGQILGFPKSVNDLGIQMLQAPTPLYLIARMNGALAGTATILVTYLAARRLFDARMGLVGALLLAVAFIHVRDSHYAVNDVPATFFLMVSFYFAVRIYQSSFGHISRPPLPLYILSGIFLGLAVATKYNVGIGAIAILVAHLLSCTASGWSWRLGNHLPLFGAAFVSLLAFLVANPFALLDYQTFLTQFSGQYAWTSDPYDTSDLPMGGVILRALSVGTSPWMLGASALGLALLIFRRPGKGLMVGSFPLAYLVFFLFGSSLFYARFAIPVVPFVALLAGYAAVRFVDASQSSKGRWIVGGLVVALLVVPPLVVDIKHNSLLRTEDTRLQLARWVESNVPPGSKIAVEGYSLVDFWGRKLGFKKLEYSWQVNSSLRVHPLDYYRREKFDYLVASSYVYGRYHLDAQAHSEAVEYYQRLERECPLVVAFHPTTDGEELPFIMDDEITPIWTVMERSRPGPTLKLYRVGEPQRYGVQWVDVDVPRELAVGQKVIARISLRNSGNLPWPSDGYSPVRVGYRWLNSEGREVFGQDLHSPLPRTLEPGEVVQLQADIVSPTAAGVYTLQLDLVQENFSWLSAQGAETVEFEVTVW